MQVFLLEELSKRHMLQGLSGLLLVTRMQRSFIPCHLVEGMLEAIVPKLVDYDGLMRPFLLSIGGHWMQLWTASLRCISNGW